MTTYDPDDLCACCRAEVAAERAAATARLRAFQHECSYCGAGPGQVCRSAAGNTIDPPHADRRHPALTAAPVAPRPQEREHA